MTGHVRRRGARSWELKFDLGTDSLTGRRLTRFHSFKGTKREADIELAKLVAAAATGGYTDPSKATVGEFLDRWERDWAVGNVSPKTIERYREIIKKHIKPHIGSLKVQKLRALHLQELYRKLLADGRAPGVGLAPRTVGHVHRVLHRSLGHAAQWGVVHQNVATLLSPPPVESAEVEILRADDVKAVLTGLRGQRLHMIATLGLATGMRRGELLALRWKDVDFDRGRVQVEQSIETTKEGGTRFKPPKTKHGRRAITLPKSTVALLRAHWKAQQEGRLALGMGRAAADDLVFSKQEGEPLDPDAISKEWTALIGKLNGVPKVKLHSLRHTHASQLIASGLDVLTISRRLGHSTPTITLAVYGHLFSNTDDVAAQVMEAALTFGTDGEH